MDSITQATLGGLCGEITLRKQLGWKGIAWGLFVGTLPDLDIIAYPWLDKMQQLSWHRGISHSLLACFLIAPLLGWLIAKIHHQKAVTYKQATWFVFITWLTHILIDTFTSYGTQIFEPFSDQRIAFNNMSIIDISFTVPMLLGLLLVLFFKRDSKLRTSIGRGVVAWLCIYTTASFTLKFMAQGHLKQHLKAHGIVPTRTMTAPTISNIFLWRMLAESEGQYHIAYWSLFDSPDRAPHVTSTPHGHAALEPFHDRPQARKLIWFSKGWHKVVSNAADSSSLLFIDMRFTEIVHPKSKAPVFVWHLRDEEGELTFRQTSFRDKTDAGETLDYLWRRIGGGAPEWMTAPWPWESRSSTVR